MMTMIATLTPTTITLSSYQHPSSTVIEEAKYPFSCCPLLYLLAVLVVAMTTINMLGGVILL